MLKSTVGEYDYANYLRTGRADDLSSGADVRRTLVAPAVVDVMKDRQANSD